MCPCASAAIVLTHGSPWVRFNAPRTSLVLRALLKPRAVSEARRLVAFGSLRAYAVVVVQGSGSEAPSEVTTGPYRVHHWVLVTGSPPWTATVTRRSVIRSGLPSTRYVVGSAGSSVSWCRLRVTPVATVWLQATCALWPMEMVAEPSSEPPAMFSSPGMVCCDCQKRRPPCQG